MFGGEIEVDESYFGGKRKGKRGRGAAGKITVLGLSLPDSGLFTNHEKVKKGWESLYQDYPRCFRRHADPHHRAQGCARFSVIASHSPASQRIASFIPTAGGVPPSGGPV